MNRVKITGRAVEEEKGGITGKRLMYKKILNKIFIFNLYYYYGT